METIKVIVEGHVLEEVADEIQAPLREYGIDVQIKPASVGFDGFSLEPASIIASGASVLSALITALLSYLVKRKSGTKKGRGQPLKKDKNELP